ncbi:dihydroorotase [Ignicoccus pacificus DSM 13166]|uniref:Dihydroorotase n=1 Tax=Ignicoccus pacificus DSM 13166 TaxID=940294 RepID=A0A977K8W6_9CREN|nr:dihydroorotase [Ignicoccus pacificus DSM 13166]
MRNLTKGCEVGFKGKTLIDGELREVTLISKGEILEVRSSSPPCPCEICIKENDLIALPGMIDIHIHARDWNLSYKETIESATRAALRGGVVAVFDMPNTSPKVDTFERVKKRIEDFNEKSYVDFGVYSALPPSEEELRRVLGLPIAGIKLFPEDYRRAEMLRDANVFTIVHPEWPDMIKESPNPGERSYTRNPLAELEAVKRLSFLKNVHFTHVSFPEAVREARRRRKSFDSTPHHLLLNSRRERELGCYSKVNPPLRSESVQRELLEEFLRSPWIISTDHAPHAPYEKDRDFLSCPSGFPGLEVALPKLLSLVKTGLITLKDVVWSYSEGPAKLMGLWPKLGALKSGSLASFTIVRLSSKTLNPLEFESKAKFSPFEGTPVGEVVATVIRGTLAYHEGSFKKPQARNIVELA